MERVETRNKLNKGGMMKIVQLDNACLTIKFDKSLGEQELLEIKKAEVLAKINQLWNRQEYVKSKI